MKSSTDAPEYLAVARIREVVESESLWICTARGSALDELIPPFEARLFLPGRPSGAAGSSRSDSAAEQNTPSSDSKAVPGSYEDLEPSFLGPVAGRFFPIAVTECRPRRHGFALRVQMFQAVQPAGGWVCIHRSLLEKSDGLYFFQIQNLPVRRTSGGETLGCVVDYFEAGENGILIVERPEGQKVYLPLHPDFVSIEQGSKEVIVPAFDDFL